MLDSMKKNLFDYKLGLIFADCALFLSVMTNENQRILNILP